MEIDFNDLSSLSDEELKSLYLEEKMKAEAGYTNQMVTKILINSLYGALGNKFFRVFNRNITRAITSNTRFYIQLLRYRLNEYLQSIRPQKTSYICYIDTDSLVGDSLIRTSNGIFKIEDLYKIDGVETVDSFNNYIKKPSREIKTLSVNNNLELEAKPIKYIMKHRVKKRLFKIIVDNREVVMTEDHSLVVLRNSKLVSIKPTEIKNSDKIISLDII